MFPLFQGPDLGSRKSSPRLARKQQSLPQSMPHPHPPLMIAQLWKRIADLETCIHNLTLQATMMRPSLCVMACTWLWYMWLPCVWKHATTLLVPWYSKCSDHLDLYIICSLAESTDLSYLDRGRLEEEYRKLKELKKKAKHYTVEVKQTAQRLSAENFKLKEDLSRERHHNELTCKNMIREMEQKMDKSVTALDRADTRLEVFELEVTERALQMIRRMPTPAMALQPFRRNLKAMMPVSLN